MPDHKDIRVIARRLEDLCRDLREENLSIGETLGKVTEAIALYRSFKLHFSSAVFEVNFLARDSGGEVEERPFDWKSLDV